MRINYLCGILAVQILVGSASFGQEKLPAEGEPLGKYLLEKMVNSMSHLKTARYHTVEFYQVQGRGRTEFKETNSGVVFDSRNKGCWRIDSIYSNDRRQDVDARYIATIDRGYRYSAEVGRAVHVPAEDLYRRRPEEFLDVRCTAFLAYNENRSALHSMLPRFQKNFAVSGRRLAAENMYELKLTTDKHKVTRRYQVDARRGFIPLKMERSYPTPQTDNKVELQSSTVTQWAERSGCIVPVRVTQKNHRGNDSAKHTFHFVWHSINEPVPQAAFSPNHFEDDPAEKLTKSELAAIEHAQQVESAMRHGEIVVKLAPMKSAGKRTGPRWSPKGTKVPLKRDGNQLVGALGIGKVATFEVRWKLSKPGDGAVFSIDLNRDGTTTADESSTIKATERRGKFWYSGSHELSLPNKDGGSRPYPISIWYVISPEESDEPEVMRWTRRGWMEGEFKLGDQSAYVVMTEGLPDGTYTTSDAWGLGVDQATAYRNSMARLGGHAWMNGVAFEPGKFSADGSSISFRAYEPGFTEEEERRKDPTLLIRSSREQNSRLSFRPISKQPSIKPPRRRSWCSWIL